MTVKLLFDLSATQPLSTTRFHGASEYAKTLFSALLDRNPGPSTLFAYCWRDLPLQAWLSESAKSGCFNLATITSKHEVPELVRSLGITRFYSALPYRLSDVDLKGPEVWLTIHGLRTLEVPTDRYQVRFERTLKDKLRWCKQRVFQRAYYGQEHRRIDTLLSRHQDATLVVPSLHTKHSLLTRFPELHGRRIQVMYSPRPQSEDTAPDTDDAEGSVKVESPYFLLLNADRWIKNTYRAVHAFDAFFQTHPSLPHRVALVGSPGVKVFGRLHQPHRFHHLAYVSAGALRNLYADAYALFYPSLNEGFGYPPLDAMHCGVPVAASATSSVPEICRDGVLYFNPYDQYEMMCRISQLCLEPTGELTSRARQRAQEVSRVQATMLEKLVDSLLG